MNPKIPSDLITYLILSAMEDGKTYGYEIIKRLSAASNGRWDVSYGTIYGALRRMEKNGLIQRCEDEEADRKYFELSTKGRRNLDKRRWQMKNLALESIDKIVGFLNVYRSVHGKETFEILLNEIKKEFQ